MSLGLSNSSISSSDAIRQALINEIEESLSQASKNQLGKTKIPESVFRICNDKDFEITNDVLEVAMKFGLDPTFRDIDENSSNKSNQLNSSNFPEGNQDYSLIQQQIYGYLLTVDLIEIGLITQEEEDEDVLDIHNSSSMSSLDKVRSLNFPKNMFDSLLLSFKSTRPALHRLLTQQIIFNNSSKPKRKKSRKDKRKDKKEKRVLDLSSLPSIIPNISPIMNPDISIPPMHYETDFLSYEDRGILLEDVKSTFSREDHLKDKISLYICKCLAEGTVTSYMCAVVYLTHLWKSRNDVIDELPLGNVIASLFEIGNENVAANKFKQKSLSPLSALLLSKETIANRAKAIEPSKTMDIHIFRESSEHSAGTVIEKDNETVVEDTDNNMIISSADEEISEEEMLAQALALSLTNVEATLLPVDSLIETNNSVVATLVETAMDTNNETEKENLVETGDQPQKMKKTLMTDPLCTFGPFEYMPEFSQCNSKSNSMSLLSIIICLTMIISCNCDNYLSENSVNELIAVDVPNDLYIHNINSNTNKKKESSLTNIELDIQPSQFVFTSLEYLLDIMSSISLSSISSSMDDRTFVYVMYWLKFTYLKVLRAHMKSIYQSNQINNLGLLGLNFSNDIPVNMSFISGDPSSSEIVLPSSLIPSNSTSSIVFKQLCLLLDIINIKSLSISSDKRSLNMNDNSFDIYSRKVLSAFASYESDNLSYQYSYLSHSLRVQAIKTFIKGFNIYIVNTLDRELLLRELLYNTSALGHTLRTYNLSTYPLKKEYPSEYYEIYLLQELCLYGCNHGFGFSLTFDKDINVKKNLSIDTVIGIEIEKKQSSSLESNIDRIEVYSKFLLHHRNYDNNQDSIELIIMQRFFNNYALYQSNRNLFEESVYFDETKVSECAYLYDRSKYLYWGEFKLLASIHNKHINLFLSDYNYLIDNKLQSTFQLKSNNPRQYQSTYVSISSNSNYNYDMSIISSNDDTTVTHIGPKAWLTVPCSQIILPNTGIYEFKFRIDKCDRGQVFVGCMTVENSIGFKETCYLGIDKQSWGLMGNSSLWHNKSKVQSDYSNGFSSRSIIILKYDSNTSTVSYTVNGTDSDVAFSSLPEEPMYIAVTLHDKDDRITLLSVKKVSSQNTKRTTDFENPNDNIYNVYSSTIPFIRYSQIMFTYIDKMLIKVQSLTSSVDISILLSHPFISIFLTSLLAAINISNFSTCQGNLLAFQLLPYLTIVSRRLVEIIESTSNILTYSSIIPIVSSIWKFHRENVSAYKSDYLVNLSNNIDQTNIKTSKTAIAIQLSGKKIEKPDLNIVGTSYGNRIKYIEEWDSGSFNVVEGRISLCGTMITGKYIDLKGCATSPSIGTLISGKCLLKPENFHPNTYNYKFQINRYTHILTQLCLRGCSRLSGTFISGIPMPVSQDSIFSNEMDVVDETLPSSGESDLSERDGDESISPANNLSNSSEIDKWMQSNLLSNGSYLTDDIISVFIERTRIYSTCVVNEETVDNTKFNTAAIAETLNPKYAYTGLINWWLERNLPVLQASISENKFKRNNFFTQIMSNSGIGGSLDEYLILHTNQTMLTKLGGSIVQTTRRYILSVLIIHSGCLPLCLAQIELIEKNKTNLGTLRPSVILLNVWKACQRIIEHIFRQKQSSGLSYSSICKLFIEKSEFLINIQSSSSSIAVHDSLLALSHEMVQKETLSAIPSESSNDIIQDSNKLISEISDFYLSNIRDMKLLTKTLLDNTIVGISRIVGLKSYMFMINKLDDLPSFLCGNSSRNYFSSVSSINFQTSIIDFITLSLYGFNDTANAINSTISSTISYLGGNEEESNKSISGHYLHNLNGLPSALLTYLQTSFESVYEFITQLLSRCTWACDYDGQYITLASWSITITPSDHQFLNRVGIFRILQTLLDDVRVIYTKNINIQSTELKELVKYSSAEGPFANDFIISTNMRLSQLALKIMYSLASQVAYIKDANTSIIAISPTAAPKLQRSISGPDTLSLSLFEMLYSELFNGMKRLMKITLQESADNLADVANINQSKAKNFTPIEGSEDSLDGEGYIGRILKLLYYVSSSKTCHHSLSSGRWFSLLISSIGCGSLSTQRRVFRLLRRLLSNTQPNDFKAYITSIFHDRDDFILSENPLDEEDINALISLQSDDSMQIDNENEKIENSTTLIQFLVEAMTVIQPTYLLREVDEKKKNLKYNLIRYYQNSKISNFIAAESLVVIRVLQGIPAWRAQINKSLLSLYLSNKVDSDIDLQNSINQSSYSKIQLIISIFGVIGGHIDRFRPGGIVSIKPYTLASQSDTLANRLASMSHTSGMFVWQSASGESIEVVLMERGINVVKQTNETKDKLVHFTTSVNGTLPVRGVRLNASDVYPSYDVPGLPEFVSPDLFLEGLVPEVMNSAIPWLINHYTNCKSATILSENANAPETQLNKKINRWVRNDVVGHDNAFNNMDYADYDENEEHDVGEQNFPEPVARIDRKLNRWVHVDQITRNNTYNMDYIGYDDSGDNDNDNDDNDNDNENENENDQSEDHDDDDGDDFHDEPADFHDEQHDLLMDFPDPAEDVERVPPKPDSDLPLNDSVKPVEVIEEKKIVEPIKKGKEEDNDAEALKCFSRVSSLKALSLSMQNFDLVSIIIENHSKGLIDMLKLSLVQIPGSLQSIESIEERWVSYCESYCSFAISSDGPVITKPSNDADSNSSASPENMEVVRPNPTREGSASRLAEAAAAVFSSYSSRNIDPAAKAEAIAQMMDMGLPKEWCETALRRCRYNVEMAINMCFEHGDDMTRFVAEDNLAQSAISSRERDIFYRSGRKPSSGADEPSPLPSDYVSMSSLARVLVGSRSTTRRDPPSDPNSAIRQLLEMGFPPSWCARAMDASSNDVAGALGWILSHGEELSTGVDITSAPLKPTNLTSNIENQSDLSPNTSSQETITIINPLVSVSGSATVSPDLTCAVADEGFPSVGCRQFPVNSGKWYYEVVLHSSGCIQIGWVDLAYAGVADSGQGVGDDIHSWAYDGWRTHLWHEISTDWGGRWSVGDVVGCAVDLDNNDISFYLNGFGLEIGMGLAYSNIKYHGGIYPCISFNKREKVQFNFGSVPFHFPPPEGYVAYIEHVNFVINRYNVNEPKLYNDTLNEYLFKLTNANTIQSSNNIESVTSNISQDFMELCKGDKVTYPLRRFFSDDTNKAVLDRSERNKASSITKLKSIDKVKEKLISTSTELCILYIRQIFVRLLLSFPKLSHDHILTIIKICNESNILNDWIVDCIPRQRNITILDTKSIKLSSFEGILTLIRLSSYFTNRTKTYIQMISTTTNSNIKSSDTILNIGGSPFLEELRQSISLLISHNIKSKLQPNQINKSNFSYIYYLLDQILIDTNNCVLRKQVDDWKNDFSSLTPYVIVTPDLQPIDLLSTPSLHFSTWITTIIMQFISMILSYADLSSNSAVFDIINDWLIRLIKNWIIGLNCSNVLVKTCIYNILSSIIQEISTSAKYFALPQSVIVDVVKIIPIERLKDICLERLNFERLNHPIYSEYIQSVLELYVCAQYCHQKYISSTIINSSIDYLDNPLCESVDDDYHSSFNWEAISGKIFSNNDDWLTMTGTIRQEELKGFTPIDGRIPERTDFPPELLIGCKVCRLCPVDSSVVEKEINDDEMLKDEPSSDDKPLSPTKEDSPQSPPEPKYEIGTVIGISSWPDDDVGTARVIKWSDGSTETVKWGVNGCEYDVTHVKVIDNKIKVRYANPIPLSVRILNTNFKSSVSFGVIVRLRKQNRSNDDSFRVTNRLVGVMEWPDFNAVVYVKGFEYSDKTWELIDYKLLSGPRDTTWSIRFGKANWMPGSIYKFQNSLDELTKPIIGSYTSAMICGKLRTTITGYISIQKQRLFLFDNKFHSSNITPSWDYLSVNKSISTSGQGCAFGNVGFSSGIHYWEFKIEQAEVGSIFIGVSEKPGSPGLSNSSKCIKWMGCGFVSDRTSYKSGSEKISVYGDHFHTGDLIGVLLDMNKGRLSFFLDGMKYGEHTLSDLGEAFDGLSSPTKVKPKTLYPVVGLSRYQDRVTITPRWLSTIGCTAEEELFLISKAWKLLTSWSFERPSSKPLDMNLWIYKDAWRDWIKWIKNQSMKIKTRCKVANMVIDISPRSCVVASLYLGLPMALFHGDHVVFDKSSGRKLETKEEVVILGVYNNQLWYRQDSQQEGKYVAESTAVAWALTQSDVEGLAILRRSYVLSSSLPVSVVNLPLPRLPMFRGGLVTLILQSGAAMRNGLEIDTSDVLREIAPNTVVFATEKRVNTSNIARYHIYYDGAFGWISERMRGGAEEVIVHVNNHSIEEIEFHKEIVIKAALELGYTARITWEEVNSLDEAMAIWELRIKQQGYSKLFERGNILYNSLEQLNNDENLSFEKYLSLSTTIDGEKNWSVEADMQLAEVLTKCAAKQGVIPQNLTYHSLLEVLSSIDVTTSLLHNVDLDRAIARAALLRTSNQVISYALPFLNLTLFEEKMHRDVYGSENEIEINPTSLPKSLISEDNDSISLEKSNVSQWQPPSWGRRLRSMRRVLFSQTKRQFWESILDHTTTLTPLHQDEYEDPREIKSISINRIKATVTKLVGVNSVYDRLRQSVFGQLHKELRSWSDGSFRRSYVGKGHGGQKRAFKVKFLGEGVNDYGGPYRAVFEQIIDELQCDRVVSKSTEKCLLPLFTPSNNRLSSVGSTQDKFLLAISPAISSVTHELMNFFGKLLGTAVRHNLNLALDLSVLVWRPLVKLPLSLVHLETVDSLFTKSLDDITKKGLQLELDYTNGLISQGLSYRPEEWEDLNFTAYLPDGSRVPLIPNGDDEPVNLGNWRNYVRLVEKCRLSESLSMFKALRDGLQSVLPTELLSIFTPGELEQIISGTSTVDVSLLKQCTEYEDISPDSPVVQNFWKVLDEFTAEDKTLFLRFVWARSRMPTSAQDLSMNFKLQGVQGDAKIYPDKYLPHAQTCFFSLSLPLYSTKEILKEKLLYAIHNSPNMDADVRLHNADGWADA